MPRLLTQISADPLKQKSQNHGHVVRKMFSVRKVSKPHGLMGYAMPCLWAGLLVGLIVASLNKTQQGQNRREQHDLSAFMLWHRSMLFLLLFVFVRTVSESWPVLLS